MKLITSLLLFCLSFDVLAAPINELESSLDRYTYSVTVEWDQKDQSFYKEKTDAFLREVSDLVLKNGLTQNDLMTLVEKRAPTRQMVTDMKMRLAHLSTATPETLAQAIQASSQDLVTHGTNWDGETWETIGVITAVSALIGFGIWFAVSYKCVQTDYRRTTGCSSSNCYEQYCSDYEKR